MFIQSQVSPHINAAMLEVSDEAQRTHLFLIQAMIEKKNIVVAGVKPLNRYSVQPGKTFATSPSAKEKFKVLRVIADDVVIQNTATRKVTTVQVDRLLKDWAAKDIKEVSVLEDIVQTVKNVLGPVLGIFLTTALISWLTEKIGR